MNVACPRTKQQRLPATACHCVPPCATMCRRVPLCMGQSRHGHTKVPIAVLGHPPSHQAPTAVPGKRLGAPGPAWRCSQDLPRRVPWPGCRAWWCRCRPGSPEARGNPSHFCRIAHGRLMGTRSRRCQRCPRSPAGTGRHRAAPATAQRPCPELVLGMSAGAWHGTVWPGTEWHSMAWHGTAWQALGHAQLCASVSLFLVCHAVPCRATHAMPC